MIRKIFTIALLCTVLISCGRNKAAFNYSQDMVAKEKRLEPSSAKTESSIRRFIASGQFDSMAVVSKSMETLVQQTIDEVEEMKVPKAK